MPNRIAGGQDCPDCETNTHVAYHYCPRCGTQLREGLNESE